MGGYKNQQGRKPSAATIAKRLRENRGGDEDEVDEAPEPAKFPNPPTFMSTAAKAEWRRMGGRLLAEGLFNPTLDLTAYQVYCEAYADLKDATTYLTGPPGHCPNCNPKNKQEPDPACYPPSHLRPEYGRVIRNRLGGTRASPYVAIRKESAALVMRCLAEFGMTPLSRGRIPRDQGKRPAAPAAPAIPVDLGHGEDPRDLLAKSIMESKN